MLLLLLATEVEKGVVYINSFATCGEGNGPFLSVMLRMGMGMLLRLILHCGSPDHQQRLLLPRKLLVSNLGMRVM